MPGKVLMMQYVFLHGLGQTPASFESTIKEMKLDKECFCPDLSELLYGKEITYNNLYDAFVTLCDQYSEQLNLCGLSLGGILALNYAIDYPAKVKSIVLIAAQYKMPKALLSFQNWIFRFMPNSMFKSTGFGKEDFINLSKSMINLDFSNGLKNITCPVLVLCGDKDKANKKATDELSELIPKAEKHLIENSGHEVNINASKELAAILSKFYREI
jgi:pimeloyl-ACP methyl ester carboxylesterase